MNVNVSKIIAWFTSYGCFDVLYIVVMAHSFAFLLNLLKSHHRVLAISLRCGVQVHSDVVAVPGV